MAKLGVGVLQRTVTAATVAEHGVRFGRVQKSQAGEYLAGASRGTGGGLGKCEPGLCVPVTVQGDEAAGEPIKVRVRETDSPSVTQDDQEENTDSAEENKPAAEDAAPDAASVTNTLRLLQGVVGGGTNWLREHNWASAWTDNQAQ